MSGPISLSRPMDIGGAREPSQDSQKQRLKDASKMYEQHFLRQMVKAMRKTVSEGGGFIQKNQAEKIFSEQLDGEYVKEWSESGGIGLADLIYQQLSEKIFTDHSLGVPKGPLPLNKDRMHSIPTDSKGQEGTMKLIEQKQVSPNEMGFLFRIDGTPEGEVVQSPWNGEVLQSFRDPLVGRHTFRIRHNSGTESTVSFVGSVEPEIGAGARLEAGQRIGSVNRAEPFVAWKVTKNGST